MLITILFISIVPSKPLEGVYSLNNYLDNAEHLFVDKLKGPENFAEYKNELYTGIHGGEIVKLLPNGDVVHVAKIGHACGNFFDFTLNIFDKFVFILKFK